MTTISMTPGFITYTWSVREGITWQLNLIFTTRTYTNNHTVKGNKAFSPLTKPGKQIFELAHSVLKWWNGLFFLPTAYSIRTFLFTWNQSGWVQAAIGVWKRISWNTSMASMNQNKQQTSAGPRFILWQRHICIYLKKLATQRNWLLTLLKNKLVINVLLILLYKLSWCLVVAAKLWFVLFISKDVHGKPWMPSQWRWLSIIA